MKKNLLLFVMMLYVINTGAQSIPDDANGRLYRLCKVWGYMKYCHPLTCQINWDSLLDANIPIIKNAVSNADFNDNLLNFINFSGQIPVNLATTPPANDTNLNVDLDWINDPVFSSDVHNFLDTFKSRAGRNDSLGCLIAYNNFTDVNYSSYVDFRNDQVSMPGSYAAESYRLLNLFSVWNRFNYFAPYKKLSDNDWDSVLVEMIPSAIAANSSWDFQLVIARMQTKINDSHATFYSDLYDNYIGLYFSGLRFDRVEGKIIVVRADTSFPNIHLGDILTAINGVSVTQLADSFRDLFSASNEDGFYRRVCRTFVRNSDSSTIRVFEFLDKNEMPYTIQTKATLQVSDYFDQFYYYKPESETLCNGYGYINIEKLHISNMASIYETFKDKEAIVIDVRGYPNESVLPSLAKRFFASPVTTTRYFYPDIIAPGLFKRRSDSVNLGTWHNTAPYTGKLFLLVNQETQSASEYIAQYLSYYTNAKVVGSQTAGADGNVNYTVMPEGEKVYFTGLGWYYEDWYQCQRNGLKIDTIVRPTISGVREGKDEVLGSITGCPTSIKRIVPLPPSVRLYPNPAKNNLFVEFKDDLKDDFEIGIIDVTGKKLWGQQYKKISDQRIRIDIAGIPDGVYLLSYKSKNGNRKMAKFVISR